MRYYTRNIPGQYTVHDRKFHNQVIATCQYKEQASLVCRALNKLDEYNIANHSSKAQQS